MKPSILIASSVGALVAVVALQLWSRAREARLDADRARAHAIEAGQSVSALRSPSSDALAMERAGEGTDLRAELASIHAALERIDARLERLESDRREPATAPESAPSEPFAELIALRAEIADLTQALSERRARERSLSELEREHPEENWTALQELMDLWRQDEQAATDAVRMSTYAEVIERYGKPTEMWSNQRGTNWTWGQGQDPAGGYLAEVWLRFYDGHVTTLGVK